MNFKQTERSPRRKVVVLSCFAVCRQRALCDFPMTTWVFVMWTNNETANMEFQSSGICLFYVRLLFFDFFR